MVTGVGSIVGDPLVLNDFEGLPEFVRESLDLLVPLVHLLGELHLHAMLLPLHHFHLRLQFSYFLMMKVEITDLSCSFSPLRDWLSSTPTNLPSFT